MDTRLKWVKSVQLIWVKSVQKFLVGKNIWASALANPSLMHASNSHRSGCTSVQSDLGLIIHTLQRMISNLASGKKSLFHSVSVAEQP